MLFSQVHGQVPVLCNERTAAGRLHPAPACISCLLGQQQHSPLLASLPCAAAAWRRRWPAAASLPPSLPLLLRVSVPARPQALLPAQLAAPWWLLQLMPSQPAAVTPPAACGAVL